MTTRGCQGPPEARPASREPGSAARRRLAAVRLVVAAACDPAVALSVDALAERSGLHPWAVRRILDSPEYADLVRDVTQERVASLMLKGLARMEGIIDNGSPRNALAAFRVVLKAHKVLQDASPVHDEAATTLRMMEFLRQLEARRAERKAQNAPADGAQPATPAPR